MKIRTTYLLYFIGLCILIASCFANKPGSKNIIRIYCNENNELYQLLKADGHNCIRYEDLNKALTHSQKDEALLILAKNYVEHKTIIPGNLLEIAKKKIKNIY